MLNNAKAVWLALPSTPSAISPPQEMLNNAKAVWLALLSNPARELGERGSSESSAGTSSESGELREQRRRLFRS